LVPDGPGALPAACQLPEGYTLELVSGCQVCAACGGRLRRVRTAVHRPVGLMLGRPRVRLIHQQCTACGWADPCAVYQHEVPPGGNYAYDVIVEVGLARFCDHRQDAEIQDHLQHRWGLSVPASSIGRLADAFLDGLAAVHQAHIPRLRRQLEADGGYALHVDGTCEAETDVLFTASAQPRGWLLDAAKMTSENKPEISKLLRRCKEQFGPPLAVMRDLSQNIADAVGETVPQARDLICQYHFLENVGKKLCEQPHAKLTAALRKLKLCPALRSIRTDLVRWSRAAGRLSAKQIEHVLEHPDDAVVDVEPVALRRLVAYLTLRWLDDYTADLQGEYFPFDLPQLAFYRRGRQLAELLGKLVASPGFPQRELCTLKTIAGHLRPLCDDTLVGAAARLELAAALFEELRQVLRLSSSPGQRWQRGRGSSEETLQVAQAMQRRLENWHKQLRRRHGRERDEQRRADQAIVLQYLEKYHQKLVGHVIARDGGRPPLVVRRTNNPAEHRFGSLKQGLRRKVGVKKLTRHIQALRAEAFLVDNLANREYVELVLDGHLANLPAAITKHWPLAQAARKERTQHNTDHPMPTTKQQLRHPALLETVKQLIGEIAESINTQKPAA
jgi:hypothetical protein